MPLPPKRYFPLAEIAERWNAPLADLTCYSIDGLLQLSIMTVGVRVEVGTYDRDGDRWFRISEGEEFLHGPQPVIAADLWTVFRHGSGTIERFQPRSADGYVDLAEGVDSIPVTMQDLLVTREERDRFEAAHGLGAGDAPEPKPAPDAGPGFIHRNNYAEIVIAGQEFQLGIIQAAIVKQLHEASQTDDTWCYGKGLLVKAGANTMRMVDLFKAKRNWRALIVSDGRGRYRLNLPDRPAARPTHRAYRRLARALDRMIPPPSHPHPTLIPHQTGLHPTPIPP